MADASNCVQPIPPATPISVLPWSWRPDLEGIEQDLDPGDPHTDNMYLKTKPELDELGISLLPRTLGEAVEAFGESDLARNVFGAKMFDTWLDYKRQEWLMYLNHVSDWEQERYLRFF